MKIMRHLTKTEEKDENKNEKMTIIEDNARFDLFWLFFRMETGILSVASINSFV